MPEYAMFSLTRIFLNMEKLYDFVFIQKMRGRETLYFGIFYVVRITSLKTV